MYAQVFQVGYLLHISPIEALYAFCWNDACYMRIVSYDSSVYMYLFTAIGLLPGGSGYFTCKQNMKLVTTRFKSGGLHEKHVVATWNVGNRLSICL